jgi:hypothetical protein
VKAALYQAERDRIITDNPAERVESPEPGEPQREFLEIDELKKLVKTECRYPVLKRAFLFSVLTGMR